MIIRRVEKKTFRDTVVFITGNRYFDCEFHDCTFVFSGFPCEFDSCSFHGAQLWRLEFTVHDSDQWDNFMSVLAGFITKTIPKKPPQP